MGVNFSLRQRCGLQQKQAEFVPFMTWLTIRLWRTRSL
jgi:hypothetical protein